MGSISSSQPVPRQCWCGLKRKGFGWKWRAAQKPLETCSFCMFSLKTDLLLVKQTFTSPGYTIAGFGCQIHVASYCWNASVLHFAQFSFPPFIRSLWTFSPCLLTISERCWGWRRRGWGMETPLVLEPPSAVLFRFFCLTFPSFLSSLLPPTLLLTSLVSYPPSLEVTLRSHLRHGVFRLLLLLGAPLCEVGKGILSPGQVLPRLRCMA